MIIRLKQADTEEVNIPKKQGNQKSKTNITFTNRSIKLMEIIQPKKKKIKEEWRNIEPIGKQGLIWQ